jgi:hypothetical protein
MAAPAVGGEGSEALCERLIGSAGSWVAQAVGVKPMRTILLCARARAGSSPEVVQAASEDGFCAWWPRVRPGLGIAYEKGIRWMPWHQEAMKDVARCEKPRGAASRR